MFLYGPFYLPFEDARKTHRPKVLELPPPTHPGEVCRAINGNIFDSHISII